MTTATLGFSKIQKNLQTKISSVALPSINWKSLCFVCFFMSIVLLIFYVWQVNSLIKGSYVINSYNNQVGQLSDINKNLQISFAESSFLGQALVKIQNLNFQKTTSVKYIQILNSSAQAPQEKTNL